MERVLEERVRHEDPESFKRFSARIREIIEQMRSGWLAAAEALKQVEEVDEEVLRPKSDDVPADVREGGWHELDVMPLAEAAERYLPHLGQDSFFDLA